MRMMRAGTLAAALAAVTVVSSGGCGFAVRHPAITAGIVGGTLGITTCELASSDHQSCLLVSGGAAAFLGLVAATALWLGDTGEESILQPPPDYEPPPRRRAQHRPAGTAGGAGSGAGGATTGTGGTAATPPAAPTVIPDYLKRPPELYARDGGPSGSIVRAPAGDQAVAATYATSPVRGPVVNGARITILTERTTYKLGEEVRVIHVLEAPDPGTQLYVMGPKAIYSEYVDGADRTGPAPAAQTYDGAVLQSPGVDFNYEVTTYKFTTPGPHRIQWRDGGRESNVIEVQVAP